MNADPSPDNRPAPNPDDSFWNALFKQEESNPPPGRPDAAEDASWSNISRRIDGRFRWSDGGKPEEEDPWLLARQIAEADDVLRLSVTGYNKGGLLVQWKGIQGFVPASQLTDFPQFHVERERVRALKEWVDKTLDLKVIEVNRTTNRLILSERAALVDAEERISLLDQIDSGDVVRGLVTNLTNFGAFVDLGGVEGLIHISELSWSRVTHPSDLLSPGETVRAIVLSIDRVKGRIALSLKRLRSDPWQSAEQRYQPGQIVEGVVSNVVSYGAFVQLEEELEGLIHVSELAEGTFLHPRNVVQQGDRIAARVINVDSRAKRLALSLRNKSHYDNNV